MFSITSSLECYEKSRFYECKWKKEVTESQWEFIKPWTCQLFSSFFFFFSSWKDLTETWDGCEWGHVTFKKAPLVILICSLTIGACVCVCAKLLQLYQTLCDPMDYSPPGSSVHGILQARKQVGCHALPQGIFPTRGSNLLFILCLLHWQGGSLPLMPPGAVMATVSYFMPQKVKYIVQVRKQ